jgi:hypothetical protein
MHGTIMHDASYIGTIELIGILAHLKLLLSHCCDPQGTSPTAIRWEQFPSHGELTNAIQVLLREPNMREIPLQDG